MCYPFIMRKRLLKILNLIVITGITTATAAPLAMQPLTVQATIVQEIENIQERIEDTQNHISDVNDEIDKLEDEQDIILERIDDLNAEIINTMTSIGMKEDEIAAKELEISNKQLEIEATQKEYEAAKEREEQQYAGMTSRTKMMYENSDVTYLTLLLQGTGFKDLLNQMDYIQRVYQYDRQKLAEYEDTKNEVHDLWDLLETEKIQLEADKQQLEADKTSLQNQKDNLDVMLEQKEAESENYEEEIKEAQKEAKKYKEQLQKEQAKLEELEEEQRREEEAAAAAAAAAAASEAAAKGNYTELINNSNGSDLGKTIAIYACQYIGNPYVYGGTSLTNGADCSGFVFRVYSDFGYRLPRTSFEQRSAGRAVDYSEAQPGDLICYDGHIGIYIGGGKIVHASTVRTGIKVSNADYRPILSVRRII